MSTKASEIEFRSLLHKAGFKATPARLAVLGVFNENQKPLSIKDMHKALSKKDVDQATLYRIVKGLAKKGIVREVDFKHGHSHYEIVTKVHHHHIICEKCGKVKDVKCDTKDLEKQVLKSSGFRKIQEHSLEFFGVCRNCKLLY